MKIQEAVAQTGINKRNIHFYIKENLISPAVNPDNNYYDFSEEDIQRLIATRELRNAGLSIPTIRSMFNNPSTSAFHISQRMKQLKMEQRHIEQTLTSLQYVLDELPFFADFGTLKNLCLEAKIPEPMDTSANDDSFDKYSTLIINRFLWEPFLPKEKFTDYQEFLWLKLNKQTFENPSPEYKRLGKFLFKLPNERIDKLFVSQNTRYELIASLDESNYVAFAEDMIITLNQILDNENLIAFWIANYDNYFHVVTNVHASPLSAIIMELSPYFDSYVRNISKVLNYIYDYLISKEGAPLRKKFREALGYSFDFEFSNHGELEALASITEIYKIVNL